MAMLLNIKNSLLFSDATKFIAESSGCDLWNVVTDVGGLTS